jgi:hypothetical protein
MTKNQPLEELKNDVIADSVVDADEVEQLRKRIFDDGIINGQEAEFLFEVNEAVSDAGNDPSSKSLFVEALTSHVLEYDESPGEIDELKAAWLVMRIEGKQQYDKNEKALLANIKSKTTLIPAHFKAIIDSCVATP